MRILKVILIGVIMALGQHAHVLSQDRIDSLRSILDNKAVTDSAFVKTTLELCKILVNTENEYLLPEYALKGLEADTLGQDIHAAFILYQYLGNYYWQVGRLNDAAEQFNQMRLIGETHDDKEIMANSYNGLGTVYYLMDAYREALDYYRKGLSLAGTDTLLMVRFYNNIANVFTSLDALDSVLPYYNKSVEYHISHQNYRYLSIVYANIALVYKKLHNGLEIRKNIDLALSAAIKADDPYQMASVYQSMGYLATDLHPELAEKSYSLALDLARKSHNFDQIRVSLENLSYLAEKKEDFRKANVFLTQLKEMDDSLDLEQRKSRVSQLEFEHLTALRNIDKVRKAQSEELHSVREQNRQKILLIIISVAFIFLAGLLLMGYQVYRYRMKITRTKEKFFAMIAHDIRNPFSGILGLAGLLNEEAEKHGDPLHRKHIHSLHQSLNQVYDLLENLLQWSQTETGKIAFNPQVQLLSPFVHEVICLHSATAKMKHISLENQIQKGLTARFDSNMLQTVIRNLLSNAIKFSPENRTVFVSAEVQGKQVVVKVRDEGIGMDPGQLEGIFHSDVMASTPGTRNEAGTGLGLALCKNFIKRHGGRIWVESKVGAGTTIAFTLPD
jgi:signal transduction histidine kinase